MKPVLLNKSLHQLLPENIYKMVVGQGQIAVNWKYWVGGLIIAAIIAWWGLAPNANKGRRILGWLATLGALVFAVLLGAVGLGRLPSIQLHTYGVLVAVGFLIGIVLAVREARRVGIDAEKILDLAFWLLIAAMVGARLFYVGLHWREYATDFQQTKLWYNWKVFRLWEGGLLYYGGFLLALIVFWLFVRFYKLNFWQLADILVPSVAIGQFFGQLGSYAAGFGYGKISNLPWSVTYSEGAAVKGIALHPTQLYEALGVLVLFVLLLWIRSAKKYHGQAFLWYMLLFPILSFTVELFRADPSRGFVLQHDLTPHIVGTDILSWSQLISLIVFVLAALLMTTRKSATPAS